MYGDSAAIDWGNVNWTSPGSSSRDGVYTNVDFDRDETLTESPVPPPTWLLSTVEEMLRLLALKENWNTYGAPPLSPSALQGAAVLLCELTTASTPKPAIIPTSRGAVQIEWHTDTLDLEIEVLSPTDIKYYFEDERSGEEIEGEASYDLGGLRDLVERLSAS